MQGCPLWWFLATTLLVCALGLVVGASYIDPGHYGADEKTMIFFNKTAHVCIPPKDGTTSFYEMLYESLAGGPYPMACTHKKLWAQSMRCGWTDVPGFKYRNGLPPEIGDSDIYSLTVRREPIARLISSWQDKARCRRCAPYGGHNPDIGMVHVLLGNREKDCLTFREFLDALEKNPNHGNSHFKSQSEVCGSVAKYQHAFVLENVNSSTFEPLLRHLGGKIVSYPHTHTHARAASPTKESKHGLAPSAFSPGSHTSPLPAGAISDAEAERVLQQVYTILKADFAHIKQGAGDGFELNPERGKALVAGLASGMLEAGCF